MKRRAFLRRVSSGVAGGALAASTVPYVSTATEDSNGAPPQLKKAIKLHMFEEEIPVVEKFRLLKEMGFDGVEPRSPSEQYSEDELLEAQEKSGLPIHGVVAGWKSFGHPDPGVRAEHRRELETALRQADTFGASTVLLVPAIVNKEIPYDKAYHRSQGEIRKVLPLARDLEVKIALENVSNHFLYSPLEFARYIDEFYSSWVGAYFDVGNIVGVTNDWPEQWVRILGSRLLKLDIKEFTRGSYSDPGERVKLGDGGDMDWPAIRDALADVGFQGWATAEVSGGDREQIRDIGNRMDQILRM